MAGEFGRTPKVSQLPQFYKQPGRDHWGAVQTVFFAGGGVHGGTVDRLVRQDRRPIRPPVRKRPRTWPPRSINALGIPPTAVWHDESNRPHHIYYGEPIAGLM